MNLKSSAINTDLILRERLAVERTKMANDRTLLSFIRTSLYFAVAGLSINQLLELNYGALIENVSWFLSVLVMISGIWKYLHTARLIRESKKSIGAAFFEQ